MPLISIIVPIYNGEKFIEKLVSSLHKQSVFDFELICINDGSSDKTKELLMLYEEKYTWIKVIDQKNKGSSGARNAGLFAANGKYIMFLDVDDYLEERTIEVVADRIHRYHPDLVDFGMLYVDNYGNKNSGHNKLPKEILIGREIIESRIIPHMINVINDPEAFIYDYAWNKVYRKDIIEENNILFLETRRTWEDRVFVVEYLKYVNSYLSMDEYLYNYVSVEGSLSRRYDFQFFDIILENYNLYYQWFSERYDFDTAYAYKYWSNAIENMIMRSLEQKTDKEKILENIKRILKNPLVISWFAKRELITDEEKKVNQFLESNEIDCLLRFYMKKLKKQKREEIKRQIKYKIYRILKK